MKVSHQAVHALEYVCNLAIRVWIERVVLMIFVVMPEEGTKFNPHAAFTDPIELMIIYRGDQSRLATNGA